MRRPSLFIGSSIEGLSIAYALQENLEFDCDATVWSQGVFNPTSAALHDLYAWTKKTEFALFVFTPDDTISLRGKTSRAVRDNVLFELGLFIGALGPSRCFFLVPHGEELHLPSDLLGIEPLRYISDRTDQNLRAALGPACNRLRRAMVDTAPAVPSAASAQTEETASPDEMAERWLEAWNSEPLLSARKTLNEGIPFHQYEDEDGSATLALTTALNFLNSVSDGVLSGRVNEDKIRETLGLPISNVWNRAFSYFSPTLFDPSDFWNPRPAIAELNDSWSNSK